MVLFRIPTVTFPRRKGIHLEKTIIYGGSNISVSDEVAEFLVHHDFLWDGERTEGIER